MIANKADAYPRVELLKGASLGQAPALPANIRLGWKNLPGTNALAYYQNSQITAVKSLITLSPLVNVIKLGMAVIYDCLSLIGFSTQV
jgi:hypothetical protein